jgi:hypothetical protein
MAHVLQDVASLLSRQIDVENDQGGTRGAGVGVYPIEKVDGLLPVGDDVERNVKFGSVESFLDQEHVGFVVLHHEHVGANRVELLFRRAG